MAMSRLVPLLEFNHLGSSGIAANPLRTDCWQESCGTLRTFVGLTPRPGAKPLCDRTGDLTKLANFGAPGNMPILACYIFCFVCADPIDARKVGHPWTIEALAPAVGMSSSLIAQHLRCHHRRREIGRAS